MYNNINLPPSFVNVMNVNSAMEEPAMLCASILSWYTDAGVRPEMVNLLCGFKALDTVTKGKWKHIPKSYTKLNSN